MKPSSLINGLRSLTSDSNASVLPTTLLIKLLLIVLGKGCCSQYGYELIYGIAVPYKLSSPFLYLVMVMLHRLLHVKQLRSYYANEAKMDPFYRVRNGPCISFVPLLGTGPSSRY